MSCARRDHGEAKKRAKKEGQNRMHVLMSSTQIFAALMQEDDLQKLVELLLVTNIVRERT